MERKSVYSLVLLLSVMLFACGNKKVNDPNKVKVGVESGPEYVIAQTAQKVAKEKYGLNIELVQFSDYIMPNTALSQGDIDVNVYQHRLFLEDQMKQRGYKFAIVGKTFLYPMAGYSKKIKNLDELKDGSTIVIPNDVTNVGRALLLLQKEGLITVNKQAGLIPRLVDIVGNPKHLKIIELEAPQLPRVLDDNNVVIAVINNNFAAQAGLLLTDGIFAEDKDSPYVNLVVSREDNKDEDKVKKVALAFQSEEVLETAEREFKGGAIKGW